MIVTNRTIEYTRRSAAWAQLYNEDPRSRGVLTQNVTITYNVSLENYLWGKHI